MPEQNRVTPYGSIVAIEQRGMFMGNRGSIHKEPGVVVRKWQVRRWITCVLSYKDWVAPKWEPGRWTPLFFWDEAVALAAGHRPCALCRRPDYKRWLDAWESAHGERPTADPMDRVLHEERLDGRAQRRHQRAWSELPAGTFVLLDGAGGRAGGGADADSDETPALVLADRLVPWFPTPDGYGAALDRPSRGRATVLTPRPTVEVLRAGYAPALRATPT